MMKNTDDMIDLAALDSEIAVALRRPYTKGGSDLREVVEVVARHVNAAFAKLRAADPLPTFDTISQDRLANMRAVFDRVHNDHLDNTARALARVLKLIDDAERKMIGHRPFVWCDDLRAAIDVCGTPGDGVTK